MLQKLYYLMLSVILISSVTAFQTDFQVGNINGGQPLESVIITLYNNESNQLNTSTTNALGLASMDVNETVSFYNVNYQKLGFHTLNKNISFDPSNNTVLEYMYPISQDGLVRLRISDLLISFGIREYCFFYTENDRLEGCYKLNDTPQLIVNKEYYIVPTITQWDMFSSPENLRVNTPYFSGLIPTFLILFVIFLIGHYIWRKSKRR